MQLHWLHKLHTLVAYISISSIAFKVSISEEADYLAYNLHTPRPVPNTVAYIHPASAVVCHPDPEECAQLGAQGPRPGQQEHAASVANIDILDEDRVRGVG